MAYKYLQVLASAYKYLQVLTSTRLTLGLKASGRTGPAYDQCRGHIGKESLEKL